MKPRMVASLERPSNTGLHPCAARAPLDGIAALLPQPSPCLHVHACCLLCDLWGLKCMVHVLFSRPFLEFDEGILKVLGTWLTLFNPAFPKFA